MTQSSRPLRDNAGPREGPAGRVVESDPPGPSGPSSPSSSDGGKDLPGIAGVVQRAGFLLEASINLWVERVRKALDLFMLSFWVGGILYTMLSFLLGLLFLPHPIATAVVAIELVLIFMPITEPPEWLRRFIRYNVRLACDWNRCEVVCDDPAAFKEGEPLIYGLEPHGVMPVALAEVFNGYSGLLPVSGDKTHALASSACFWAPFIRHLWWYLGVRPVGKASMRELLAKGHNVALNPGGVVECLRMKPGHDVVYLRNRRGFVRLAQETGAKIVPTYVFGHGETYDYIRPKGGSKSLAERFSRKLGFAPMIFWGYNGTPIPKPVKLTVVLGRPIEIGPASRSSPAASECLSDVSAAPPGPNGGGGAESDDGGAVQVALEAFIKEMERIHAKYKGKYGHPERTLEVL